MKLYCARHGEAEAKDVDRERPLTEKGQADVESVARFMGESGLHLDAKVDVWIKQSGRHELEVDSFEMRDVYLWTPQLDDDLLLLDLASLKTRHKRLYEAFRAACEAEALRQANAAQSTAWHYSSYPDEDGVS